MFSSKSHYKLIINKASTRTQGLPSSMMPGKEYVFLIYVEYIHDKKFGPKSEDSVHCTFHCVIMALHMCVFQWYFLKDFI